MKRNIGILDRFVRIAIAALIAILYLTYTISGTLALVLLAIGAILLLTAFCKLLSVLCITQNKYLQNLTLESYACKH